MSIIIDVVLLIFIAYNAYKGYKKGFIDVAINFLGIFVIIFLIWLLATPITNNMLKKDFAKKMESNFKYQVEQIAGKSEEEVDNKVKEENKKLSAKESNFLDLIVKIKNKDNNDVKEKEVNFSEYIAKNLTKTVIKAIVSIVLFIVLYIALIILNKLFSAAANTFTISSALNDVGGMLLATFKALVIIYVLLFAIRLVSPVLPNKVNETIKSSILTKKISEGDFLINKIMGVKK